MITVEKVTYAPWGNCIRVSNGTAELYATIDFGPRIIRFGAVGHENMFFEDIDCKAVTDLSAYPGYFHHDCYRLYGGHRLWAAPEALPRTYFTDHDPVEYECLPNGVVLKQMIQPTVRIAASMKVTMAEDGTVTILHTVENHNVWPITLAPWSISALCKDGLEVVPIPQEETGLLPNACMSLWPYTKMNDHRVYWGEKFITVRQDRNTEAAFKFGLSNTAQYAAYFAHNCLFVKKFAFMPNETYPDFGMNFETYTASEFLEMESLAPMATLEPGASASHEETWAVYANVAEPSAQDEAALQTTLAPYIDK